MEKIKVRLHAKASSYLVNAIADAKIEEAIIRYIKSGLVSSNDKEIKRRVKNLIYKTPSRQKLLVKAFAYKHVNGYANYWYSKFFFRISKKDFPRYQKYYSDANYNPFIHLVKIIFFYPQTISKYAKKNKFNITLNKQSLKKEILNVQKTNIKINRENAVKIKNKKADSWKIKKLVQMSKTSKYPDIFLNSAAKTQLSAGRWDKVYSFLL